MKFGHEMDILLMQKYRYNHNLYRKLIGTEKPSPSTWASTTSILHSKAGSQRQYQGWEMSTNVSINKDKGMQTQAYNNGAICCYSLFTLKVSPPSNASKWLNI